MIDIGMELPSNSVDSTLRTAQLFTQSTISTNVFQKSLIDFDFESPGWILISKALDRFCFQKSLIDFDIDQHL